jgi:hypothetical protein
MSCFGGTFGGGCGAGFSSNAAGVTSGGTLCQLIALGAADTHLTACPTVTFWRLRIQKCTNFAMESIMQTYTGTVAWGSEVQITLNRTGDLVYWMYVILDIPAIRAIKQCSSGSGRDRERFGGFGFGGFPFAQVCDACDDGRAPNRCNSEFSSECSDNCSDSCSDDGSCSSDRDRDHSSSEGHSCCGSERDETLGLRRPFCNWVDSIGFAAIHRAAFSIGGQVIDTVYSHFMHMWEELSGQPGKRLEEMIGHTPFPNRAALVEMSKHNRRLYVPLPFYFTRNSGNTLPLVSLQFHALQVHIHFAPLGKLIQVSDCDTLVVKCCDGQPIGQNDMRSYLDTTYVYLDQEERDRFAVGSFQQLITQLQHYSVAGNTAEQIVAQLNFNHPTLELIWAVQRQCQAVANNTFNYSGAWGRDPIRRAKLLINNLCRFEREAEYFRMVQPYQCHTNIPHGFIYVYSFALFPEDCQPSGSLNFSRIDNVEFSVCLQEAIAATAVNLLVFGRNWNILRFKEGLGGLLYSN